ncbi:MAG: hypothetical protein HPY61_00080 [Methanotrichaceae archaeon]|nr:hypothetical protein [Methanotrichaceae archaeon]
MTAIVTGKDSCDDGSMLSAAKINCKGVLILESSTAERDLPEIGVKRGDQFLRIWAKPDHGLAVGGELRFAGIEQKHS